MPAPPEHSPEQQAQLVAYLDGELDEQEVLQVEQWLTQSQAARRELERLQRTWDLLGVLPENKASQDFTQQTVSQMRKLALAGQRQNAAHVTSLEIDAEADAEVEADVEAEANGSRRAAVLTLWSVLLGLSMTCGYLTTHRWWRDASRPLIDELPLLENVDRYQEASDLEFLRELRRRDALAERSQQQPPP